MTVSVLGDFRTLTDTTDTACYLFAVRAYKHIPSCIDRLHPLGFIPERHAGYAVKIGLFLNPAGIGQNCPRVLFQHDHIHKGERWNCFDMWIWKIKEQTVFSGQFVYEKRGSGSGVQGEDYRALFVGDGLECDKDVF